MNEYDYRESRKYVPLTGNNNVLSAHGRVGDVLTTLSRLCRAAMMTITIAAAVAISAGDGGIKSAQAAGLPLLLTLKGPQNAQAGKPLRGIIVRLVNPGLSAPASRLRLLIHDEMDRELAPGDIRIDVREGNVWKEVKVEMIDGGVMGAIGEKGKPHSAFHQRGGFAIAKKAIKVWPLRVAFRLPGRYSLVAAVSPDNGETQLAQPASLNLVAS